MYAIIEVGAKQYKVQEKDIVEVEKTLHKAGKEFDINKILLVKDGKSVHVGQPYVKDYKVSAELVRNFRGPKVISFKTLRRKDSRWKKGHRQYLSAIKITKILAKEAEKKEESTSKVKK